MERLVNVFEVPKKKSAAQFVQNEKPISKASLIPDGQVESDLQRHCAQPPSCSLTIAYCFRSKYPRLCSLNAQSDTKFFTHFLPAVGPNAMSPSVQLHRRSGVSTVNVSSTFCRF